MQSRQPILVVDDDPVQHILINKILESAGHEVEQATSGPEALEKIKADRPGIVLSDQFMPGMDGLELLRAIKQFDASVQVVLYSGALGEATVREAMALGAFGCVAKDVSDHTELITTLDRAVTSRAHWVACLEHAI